MAGGALGDPLLGSAARRLPRGQCERLRPAAGRSWPPARRTLLALLRIGRRAWLAAQGRRRAPRAGTVSWPESRATPTDREDRPGSIIEVRSRQPLKRRVGCRWRDSSQARLRARDRPAPPSGCRCRRPTHWRGCSRARARASITSHLLASPIRTLRDRPPTVFWTRNERRPERPTRRPRHVHSVSQ